MPLPGDKTRREVLDEVLRVNHAGELGAQQIYRGQLAILGKSETGPILQEMLEQEQGHLAKFEELITQHQTRPTALLPFWRAAGFALGAGTALLGKEAAMACTVAVETVIAEHYQSQIDTLDETDSELKATLTQFRAEELEHHDIGLEEGAEQSPLYGLLSEVVQAGCRAAIAVAKKV